MSQSTKELFACVSSELGRIKTRIAELLKADQAALTDYTDYIARAGGKMFRPALVLLAGRCCGQITQPHIDIAAIIELIHTATLLHDDVIDHADERRSQTTPNKLWGNTAAVLLGDYVLTRAFTAANALNMPELAGEFCRTAEEICQGELLQNFRAADPDLSEEEYYTIIKGKTASLFGCACYAGAAASKAEPHILQALKDFGVYLGMTFQITDDLIDILADEKQAGKTLGTDLDGLKLTLPMIHYLGTLTDDQRQKTFASLSKEDSRDTLLNTLKNSNSIDYAKSIINNFTEKAQAALASIPQSESTENLSEILTAVTTRI